MAERFLKGEHVMRHNPGLWNGIWSDMYIETTFICYCHGPGRIVDITLNPNALKHWALSLHICSQIIKDVSEMGDACESHRVTTDKEEKSSKERGKCNG